MSELAIAIRRCPFCGGAARLDLHDPACLRLRCSECGALGPCASHYAAIAISMWNRRAPEKKSAQAVQHG